MLVVYLMRYFVVYDTSCLLFVDTNIEIICLLFFVVVVHV